MRIAIEVTPHRWSPPAPGMETTRRVLDAIVAAEQAGFDAVWASEDPDSWDAIAILSAAAVQTERISLCTGVVNPIYRHPALMAASISTLDRLSGGRAMLGLGRGQTEWYEHSLGIPANNPVGRLEEAIELLRQWWSPPHTASSDGPIGVSDWERQFGPLQPHLPILLAAAGPKAIQVAARLADGVIFNELTSIQVMTRIIADVRAAAVAAGRDPDSLRFVARPGLVVTNDPAPAIARKKRGIALINTLPGMDRLLLTDGFDVEGIIDAARRAMKTEEIVKAGGAFAELRREGDLATACAAIPDDFVSELAMIGPIEHVRSRLDRLREIGISEIVIMRPDLPELATWPEFVSALRA
jgi:alkanesulfonate monooxygenase SsuD/methylene tetrahydromethanopterin reductase-like flavin-dependent oxidoreductase (luciferase family)